MAPPTWCPRCLALTEDADPCPRCGLPQSGDAAARLRVVVHRLHEIDRAYRELAQERADLTQEHAGLLATIEGRPRPLTAAAALPPPAPPGATAAGATADRTEWRADVVRDVLLWIGGLLLAIAALTFAAFAWNRLDDGGALALLALTTLLAGAGALALRSRLRATAEVFAALTFALLLIDWFALRRAGVGAGLDLPTWWAIGTGAAGIAGALAGRFFVSLRLLTALALSTSAFLVVGATAHTAASAAVGLSTVAVLAVGAAVAAHRVSWRGASVIGVMAAMGATSSSAIAVAAGIADHGEPTAVLMAATASIAVAPALAGVCVSRANPVRHALLAVSVVALLASAAIGWWLVVDEPWVAALSALTATAAVIVSLVLPRDLRWGVIAGAATVLVVTAAATAAPVGLAIAGPLSSVADAWDFEWGDAAGDVIRSTVDPDDGRAATLTWLAAAAAAVIARIALRPSDAAARRDSLDAGLAGAANAIALALVPLSTDSSIAVALAITSAVALLAVLAAARAESRPGLAVAAVVAGVTAAVPAVGWAIAVEAGTLALAAATLAVSLAGVVLAPRDSAAREVDGALAALAFVTLTGSSALTAGATASQCGIAVTAAAGVALVAANLWGDERADGVAAEVMAWLAGVVGVALAAGGEVGSEADVAIALTIGVPALAVAGTRPERRLYHAAAAVVAVLASWAWLATADVELLEAYTAPAAIGALVAGLVHRRQRPDTTSWLSFAPAITIALGPTLALAVADDGLVRPVAVAVGAGALCAAGARWRLQAPLVEGAFAVVVIAIDTLGPVAAELPRWLTIAIAGSFLLWLGATADRRLSQLRRARERLSELED